MARRSSRSGILEAAGRVIDDRGVGALTLEAVASEAGMTKARVIYHFASMSALVTALHQHLAELWEAEMVAALGTDPDLATDAAKVRAHVSIAGRSASRTEVLLMTEATHDEANTAAWVAASERWLPALPVQEADGSFDDAQLMLVLAQIASDGLWGYEPTTGQALPPELRQALIDRILSFTTDAACGVSLRPTPADDRSTRWTHR